MKICLPDRGKKDETEVGGSRKEGESKRKGRSTD